MRTRPTVPTRAVRSASVLLLFLLGASCGPPVNHPPSLVPPLDRTIAVGDPVSIAIEAADPDGNGIVLALLQGPAGATLTLGGTTLSWTPAVTDVGTHGFVLSATDDGTPALVAYATFSATVYDPLAPGVNHPPTLMPPVDSLVDVGQSLTLTIEASDPDGDALTLALAYGPAGAQLTDGTLSWSPVASDAGSHGFIVAATDDGMPRLTAYASFTVTVNDPQAPGANHPPEALPLVDQAVLAGELLGFSLVAVDPDGDSLLWQATMLPAGASFDPATARFEWTPGIADGGRHWAMFEVADDGTPVLRDTVLVRIEVIVPGSGNLPPVFFGVPAPGLTGACSAFSASFEALDPEGDAVEYRSPNLPAGATLTPVGSTAVLTWTPEQMQAGRWVVAIYAVDRGIPTMSTAIAYTIEVTAPPPMAIDPVDVTVVGGQTALMPASYSAHPCYSLSVPNPPAGAVFDPIAATLTWPTLAEDFGLYDVTFLLTDRSTPPASFSETGRVTVEYRDDFTSFSGYLTHEAYYPECCQGPVSYAVLSDGAASDGSALYTQSSQSSDVLGRAFRLFDRSQIPLSGIAYELRARDIVQGWACGSGGVLYVMDFAVTDPAATWPDARSGPTPAFGEGVPDDAGGYTTVRGAGSFLAPTSALTLVLLHADNSNICTIDVFWDSLLLTPIP